MWNGQKAARVEAKEGSSECVFVIYLIAETVTDKSKFRPVWAVKLVQNHPGDLVRVLKKKVR